MTIAALATAPVPGPVGIIRISGPGAVSAAEQVFFPASGAPLSHRKGRPLVFGELRINGHVLDTGLCAVMRAPHSYTGEDVAELQLHGAPVVLNAVLNALWRHGVRPAQAGEFTRRAFLNGKLNLSQAEAVRELIAAQTLDAAQNAAGQLGGRLNETFLKLHDRLASLMAHFGALVDYPEDDIPELTLESFLQVLRSVESELAELLTGYENSLAVREGIKTTLIGKPNVGKSSLLNALVGYDRAIVSRHPGTTRDTLEESVLMGGVRLRLTDSAGLHESSDPVERQGVERSRRAAGQSGLLLVVLDASRPLDGEDRQVLDYARERTAIVLLNKCDLPPVLERDMLEAAFLHICPVSAKTREGLDYLDSIVRRVLDTHMVYDGSVLTAPRQAGAVTHMLEAVRRARLGLEEGITPDAALSELESAMAAVGELTGRSVSEDVLDMIFSEFCVGK